MHRGTTEAGMTTETTPYFNFGLVKRPRFSGREDTENNRQHMTRWLPMIEAADKEEFRGVTSDGHVIPGLFPVTRTGVSTQPLLSSAKAFLGSLETSQRAKVSFPVDSREWQH